MNSHKKLKHIYVGIDCHKNTHTASIVNAFNEELDTITFDNNRAGFKAMFKVVSKHTNEGITAVFGLEDCNHLGHSLASFLLSQNCIVKVVNATYTHSERKNSPTISKTDEIDALCLAKVTLDRLDKLPNATSDDLFWTLKQLVKMRESIIKTNAGYKHKLHAQLLHHYPNYTKFFTSFDCKTALALWENYPNPTLLMKQSKESLTTFIYKISKGYFNDKKVTTILELVNEYDYSIIDYQEERDTLIKMLVKQIRYNNEQLALMNIEINTVVAKTGYKLDTFIGVDKILAAKIISEIGNINRFPSSDKLARYAGVAPVCFSSGGKDKKVTNKYGNRKLNGYIFVVACVNINPGTVSSKKICSPIFLDYYQKKVSEGKTSHQALLQVMRRIINIIYGMMKNKAEYVHPQELNDKFQNIHRERIDKEKEEAEKEKNS